MIDTKTAIEKITNGEFDNFFTDIYIDSSMIDYQKKRYVHAIEQYETIFCPDKVAIFSAPGRSEVCGNHTDHQHGMVLATSINLDTIAVSAKNNNDVVRFVSDGYDMITLNINDLEVNDDEAGTTVSLIRGVLRGLKDHGYKIGGFNAYATSDVLVGAGGSFAPPTAAGVLGGAEAVRSPPVEVGCHVGAALAAAEQASKDVDVLPDVCFVRGNAAALVPSQQELHAAEYIFVQNWFVVVLDGDPFVRVALLDALAV